MAGRLRTIDARTLADAVLEPPGYAVKDLLVQGLHILAGAPKTGKSWLALWLCQQVAGGEKVWGHPTQQGTVLYLCLEDGYHRLQDRLLENQRDIRVTRRYFEFMRPYTREYARKKSADGRILPAAGFLSAFAPRHRVFELLPLCGNRAGRCAAVRKGVSAALVSGVPGRLAADWIASPPR